MKESRENFVELKGFLTADGVQSVLNYLYTGVLNLSLDKIDSVLNASSHLQINEILDLCSDYLIKHLSILNCVSILKLAGKTRQKRKIKK
jgi:hypothetical protein